MTKKIETEVGLGAMHEISVGGSLEIEGTAEDTVITSTIHRPGVEPETLVYLRDTPISDILKDSSAMAGLKITEMEIEDIQDKVKRTGFPIKVGGELSTERVHFELDLKAKEEIRTSRKVKIRFSK